MFYLKMFGISLLLTLLIEMAVALILRIKNREFLMVFLVNVFTNPAAVYIAWVFDLGLPGQLIIEAVVIIAEWLIYKAANKWGDFSFKRPFLYSLIMNVISYGAGLIINMIGRNL